MPPNWGGGVRAVPRLANYTLAFALQLRKSTENLRVAEKVPADTRRGARGHLMGNHDVPIFP
jgi:hypothetical protein